MHAKHARSTFRRRWAKGATAVLAVFLTFLLCTQTVSLPNIAGALEGTGQETQQPADTAGNNEGAQPAEGTEADGAEASDAAEPTDAGEPAVSDELAQLQGTAGATQNNLTESSNSLGTASPSENSTVDVALDLSDQATITYNNVEYTANNETMNVPAGAELAFAVSAAEGYQVKAVKQLTANGTETELALDEATGTYKVAAEAVAAGLTVKVETEAVPAAEEPAGDEAVAGEEPGETEATAGDEAVESEEAAAALSASNEISARGITGSKRVAVGGTSYLYSDSPASGSNGLWDVDYEHRWSASPSNCVRITGGSNTGAAIEGLNEGKVTITHTWGYSSVIGGRWNEVGQETYTVTVVNPAPEDLCTIKFDANGGEWNDPLNGTHTYLFGTELWAEGKDLSVPTRDGYVFEGWKPNVSRIAVSDATYVAQWKPIEQGMTPVYLYLQVTGDTTGLTLNSSGWYTIGVIYMPEGIVENADTAGFNATVNINDQRFQNAFEEAMKSIVRYGPNESLLIDDADWTKLHVQNGANDYAPAGNEWHLDGTIDAKYLANLTVNYIDSDTREVLDTDSSLRTVGQTVNPNDYCNRIFKNHTFDRVDPEDPFEISKNEENVINVYYTKNADVLRYDANGGEGTMDPTRGKAEEQVQVAENSFTREGYKFTGWNTQADGEGTPYSADDSYTLTDGDDVLYAQWEQAGHFGYNLSIEGATWSGGYS